MTAFRLDMTREALNMFDGWKPPFADQIAAEALAEVEQAEARLADYEHLRSEWDYRHDRGDHLVYRHEWEAFVAWRKAQHAAEQRIQEMEAQSAIDRRQCDDMTDTAGRMAERVAVLEAALREIHRHAIHKHQSWAQEVARAALEGEA